MNGSNYAIIGASDTWALVLTTPSRGADDKVPELQILRVIGWAFEDRHPSMGEPIVVDGTGYTDHLTRDSLDRVLFIGDRSACETYKETVPPTEIELAEHDGYRAAERLRANIIDAEDGRR
ncbi:hypothetical protein [Gordonia neofelifaecis]|uniref:Uncharacterized protein n=1 Tax=Gordonia neofelifaecis NRRL B-59395 TaxID=644548 RepID=F1YJE9_9ACTN|nr:hypothetical protein [Gordonia neofelifaecis]EGD55182.1 hypothetical protein SCNU_09929 [Gordonia neofelifaecis NRRL B-59395]